MNTENKSYYWNPTFGSKTNKLNEHGDFPQPGKFKYLQNFITDKENLDTFELQYYVIC